MFPTVRQPCDRRLLSSECGFPKFNGESGLELDDHPISSGRGPVFLRVRSSEFLLTVVLYKSVPFGPISRLVVHGRGLRSVWAGSWHNSVTQWPPTQALARLTLLEHEQPFTVLA
eukprot:758433-Hanusia_phi.AAC.2